MKKCDDREEAVVNLMVELKDLFKRLRRIRHVKIDTERLEQAYDHLESLYRRDAKLIGE